MENIKVVTICGSMKFASQMVKIALDLERKFGWCVLQCVYDFENTQLSKDEITKIKNAHFKRIEISDAIYVLNIDKYVGESVKKEIDFAQKHGKQIIFHEI